MKSEREILDLIRAIYRDVGGAPADLAHIRPLYGGWLNALKYEVVRMDKASTLLWRADLENMNRRPLTKALRALAPHSRMKRNISPVPHARYQRGWCGFSRSGVAPASDIPASAAEASTASVQADADRVGGRQAYGPAPSTEFVVLCASCSAHTRHVVTIVEQSANAVVVVAQCDTCHATIEVMATGASQPRRTIATRLKKAISLSATHRAASPINVPPIVREMLQGTRVNPAKNDGS